MRQTLITLAGTASVLLGSTLAIVAFDASAQSSKLTPDSAPAYQEHATTSPAAAAAAASNPLNTVPGKVSSGKQPSSGRANGLGMDAGADHMSKKP